MAILARVASGIRPARIALSLIPHPPPPRPIQPQHFSVPTVFLTAERSTPSRVPYDFYGKGRLVSFQMLRQISTQSSSNGEEEFTAVEMEAINKSMERLLRRMDETLTLLEKMQEMNNQMEEMMEKIYLLKTVFDAGLATYKEILQGNQK